MDDRERERKYEQIVECLEQLTQCTCAMNNSLVSIDRNLVAIDETLKKLVPQPILAKSATLTLRAN